MIFQIIALFSCGTFFGAAAYISLAQHPAALEAGVAVAGRFFPPMYARAAPLQITLALVGFTAGIVAGYESGNDMWLVGAAFLISVVPITLLWIKPINDVLLHPENNPDSEKTQKLLINWGIKHWTRTAVSAVAFLLYIAAVVGAGSIFAH